MKLYFLIVKWQTFIILLISLFVVTRKCRLQLRSIEVMMVNRFTENNILTFISLSSSATSTTTVSTIHCHAMHCQNFSNKDLYLRIFSNAVVFFQLFVCLSIQELILIMFSHFISFLFLTTSYQQLCQGKKISRMQNHRG